MTDDDLLRYSRHILLDEIGVEGQARIRAAHALVIGAGGLGSPVALYLASAGVGQLSLVDHDTVDLTNLQRQIAHRQASVGQLKVDSAADAVHALNPQVTVHPHAQRADAALLAALVPQADVVLDCCDNFDTRQAVNRACADAGVPLVSGAAVGWDGQISVYDPARDAPCYACVFPPSAPPPEIRCATMGVFAPLVGIIGSLQAAQALMCLIEAPDTLRGRLQMLDARRMRWTDIQVRRHPHCPVCQGASDAHRRSLP